MLNITKDLITTLERVLECVPEEHCDIVREAENVLCKAKVEIADATNMGTTLLMCGQKFRVILGPMSRGIDYEGHMVDGRMVTGLEERPVWRSLRWLREMVEAAKESEAV